MNSGGKEEYWQDKHYGIQLYMYMHARSQCDWQKKTADEEKAKKNDKHIQRELVKSMANIIEKRVPIFLIFPHFAPL